MKREGVVVRFGGKGFGFIAETKPTPSIQWFVHIADVAGNRELRPGDKVRFEEGTSTGNAPRAVLVELIAERRSLGTPAVTKGASDEHN